MAKAALRLNLGLRLPPVQLPRSIRPLKFAYFVEAGFAEVGFVVSSETEPFEKLPALRWILTVVTRQLVALSVSFANRPKPRLAAKIVRLE